MALIGGGGAPNVAGGSNPSGTGTGLSFVGNHAYGYSGIVSTVSENEMTLLKDNMPTGGYFVGTAQFSYANLDSDDVIFQIKINGQIAFQIDIQQAHTYTTSPQNPIKLVLSPQDVLECIGQNATGGGVSRKVCVAVVGEMIYA